MCSSDLLRGSQTTVEREERRIGGEQNASMGHRHANGQALSRLKTAQACVLSSLMLVPVGLLATLSGVSGLVYAAVALLLGSWMAVLAFGFLRERTDERARRLFLASLVYLPILLGVMVANRGSVVGTPRREEGITIIEVPPQ